MTRKKSIEFVGLPPSEEWHNLWKEAPSTIFERLMENKPRQCDCIVPERLREELKRQHFTDKKRKVNTS